MEIVNLGLEEIAPYENNPRHNDEAVGKVANSIKEFGFKQPIVVDEDGTIIVGHTRYLAAKKLGMDSVPCIVAADLDEDQKKAYRLADNKVSEFSEWDFDLLETELADLNNLIDMSDFGFFESDGATLSDFLDEDYEEESSPQEDGKKEDSKNELVVVFSFESEKEKGEILDYLKETEYVYEVK